MQESGCDPDPIFAPLPREYEEDVYATATPTAPSPVYGPTNPLAAARDAYKQAKRAEATSDWEAVRTAALEGWSLVKTPHLAYLLAEATSHLERRSEARYYSAFVLRSQDKKLTKEQRANATRWRAEAEANIGWLDLHAEPGACLVVGGLTVGLTPLGTPVAVDPGTHRIQAIHQGKRAAEEATATTGQVTKVTISLR